MTSNVNSEAVLAFLGPLPQIKPQSKDPLRLIEAAEFIPNFRLKLIFATVCNNRGIKFRDEKIEPIFHFFSNFGHLLATIL